MAKEVPIVLASGRRQGNVVRKTVSRLTKLCKAYRGVARSAKSRASFGPAKTSKLCQHPSPLLHKRLQIKGIRGWIASMFLVPH